MMPVAPVVASGMLSASAVAQGAHSALFPPPQAEVTALRQAAAAAQQLPGQRAASQQDNGQLYPWLALGALMPAAPMGVASHGPPPAAWRPPAAAATARGPMLPPPPQQQQQPAGLLTPAYPPAASQPEVEAPLLLHDPAWPLAGVLAQQHAGTSRAPAPIGFPPPQPSTAPLEAAPPGGLAPATDGGGRRDGDLRMSDAGSSWRPSRSNSEQPAAPVVPHEMARQNALVGGGMPPPPPGPRMMAAPSFGGGGSWAQQAALPAADAAAGRRHPPPVAPLPPPQPTALLQVTGGGFPLHGMWALMDAAARIAQAAITTTGPAGGGTARGVVPHELAARATAGSGPSS